MVKTSAKKAKKVSQNEVDTEYDLSIFDVRDRHQSALLAIKKKIRGCEKKIRELEQIDQQKQGEKSTKESDQVIKDRREKIANKKAVLEIWKEAAMTIAIVRKSEMSEGVTNVCMVDVIEGIDLLKQIANRENEWEYYKCPSKKHLIKSELERVRQLAQFLNVLCKDVKSTRFNSFISVVDYLTSPIAIGQDCPMTFSELVRLFDKVKNTLSVEIKVPEPVVEEPVSITNVSKVHTEVKVSESEKTHSKGYVKNNNRRPRFQKKQTKNVNGVDDTIQNEPIIPEKLTVIVSNNSKLKKVEESAPILISSDDISKSLKKLSTLELNLENNQNDSDSEGWETTSKKKPIASKPLKFYRKDGNENFKKGYRSNMDYKGKRSQQPYKSEINNGNSTRMTTKSQF